MTTKDELTSRLHHLVELGLDMKLGMISFDTLEFDSNFSPCLYVGACNEGEDGYKLEHIHNRHLALAAHTTIQTYYYCQSLLLLHVHGVYSECTFP